MIKNIIFDFGDIFINLDKKATAKALSTFGDEKNISQLNSIFGNYEQGKVSTTSFLAELKTIFPNATQNELVSAWNAILLDFPAYRLTYLEQLAAENKYRLFLLSNTNALHIEQVKRIVGQEFFENFRNCFEKFYLSHEIQKSKPNKEIYEFVLQDNDLLAQETLFVDDTKENTDSAAELGLLTWNLQVDTEDIINLNSRL